MSNLNQLLPPFFQGRKESPGFTHLERSLMERIKLVEKERDFLAQENKRLKQALEPQSQLQKMYDIYDPWEMQ